MESFSLNGCIINFLISLESGILQTFVDHTRTHTQTLQIYELELQRWVHTFVKGCESVHRMSWMGWIPSQRGVKLLCLLRCVIIPVAIAHLDQSQHCRVIPGSMSLPVLEKRGDIILGGLFSLHDMVVEPNLSFTSTPPPTQCTR